MVITSPFQDDDPIVFANDAFLALTGYAEEEVVGRNCRFLQGPETDARAVERLRRSLAAGDELTVELLNYRKDGTTFWNCLSVSPVQDDSGRVIYFFGSQRDVTAEKQSEIALIQSSEGLRSDVAARTAELEAALAQKTALLHEIDHRVKNNLQLISSLMLLQSRRITDDKARQALKSMLERVTAVATVHRRLFQGDDSQRFDVADFVRDLAGDLALTAGRDDVLLDLDLQPAAIAAASAAPFALVANELISNALRHAYPAGRGGRITVRVAPDGEACLLSVTDAGLGLNGAAKGFGLTIVDLLCRQLHAELTTEQAGPGHRARVHVPATVN